MYHSVLSLSPMHEYLISFLFISFIIRIKYSLFLGWRKHRIRSLCSLLEYRTKEPSWWSCGVHPVWALRMNCAASASLDLRGQHSQGLIQTSGFTFSTSRFLFRAFTPTNQTSTEPSNPVPTWPSQEVASPAWDTLCRLIANRQERKGSEKKNFRLFLYLNNREIDTWGAAVTFS